MDIVDKLHHASRALNSSPIDAGVGLSLAGVCDEAVEIIERLRSMDEGIVSLTVQRNNLRADLDKARKSNTELEAMNERAKAEINRLVEKLFVVDSELLVAKNKLLEAHIEVEGVTLDAARYKKQVVEALDIIKRSARIVADLGRSRDVSERDSAVAAFFSMMMEEGLWP